MRILSSRAPRSAPGRASSSWWGRALGSVALGSVALGSVALCAAAPALAADPQQVRGVRGRVVVAPELMAATEWPLDADMDRVRRTPARVRRPSGHQAATTLSEPTPDLLVVLEG